MNKEVIYIILFVLPVIEVIIIFLFYRYYSRYKKISKTETSRIGYLKNGFHEVKGKIVSLSENLFSPLSEKPCVYYNFKVQEKRGSGKNARWHTIIEDEKYRRFIIEDSSGQAIIDLNNADYNFKIDKKTDSGFLNQATPQMRKALGKYNKTNIGMLFEKTIKYKEVYLEPGDNLYVLGEAREFEDYKPVFKSGHIHLYISDKSEEEQLSDLKLKLIVSGIVLILVLSLWIYFYI